MICELLKIEPYQDIDGRIEVLNPILK